MGALREQLSENDIDKPSLEGAKMLEDEAVDEAAEGLAVVTVLSTMRGSRQAPFFLGSSGGFFERFNPGR